MKMTNQRKIRRLCLCLISQTWNYEQNNRENTWGGGTELSKKRKKIQEYIIYIIEGNEFPH